MRMRKLFYHRPPDGMKLSDKDWVATANAALDVSGSDEGDDDEPAGMTRAFMW